VRWLLAALPLLATCNAENRDPSVGVTRASDSDGGEVEAETPSESRDAGTVEQIESRVAEALASDEFRKAACRLAGVLAQGGDAELSCEEAEAECLATVGSLDAGALATVPLSNSTLELPDCELTVAQVDACLADLVNVAVLVSSELECGVDAGTVVPSIGPELLLGAPSCLLAATSCPALLELFLASMAPPEPFSGMAR
jgi:hypothetical protein